MDPAAPVLEISAAGLSAELAVLDAIARVALVARRLGLRLSVTGASPELVELIELGGLEELLHA